MAVRVTNEFVEVAVLPSAAPKIRNTNEFVEVAVLGSTPPKIRVTTVFVEIAVLWNSRTIEDSLNNWVDATSVSLLDSFLDLPLTRTEDLNNWNDSVSVLFLGGDSKQRNDSLDNWQDAITLFFDTTIKLVDIWDSIYVWSDYFDSSPDFAIQAYDTLQYNWDDSIQLNYPLQGVSLSDTLNNWKDNTVQFLNTFGTDAADSFTLKEVITLRLGYLLNVNDDLNLWNDNSEVAFGNLSVSVGDLFQLLDSSLVILTEFFNLDISDDLNNWNDQVPTPQFQQLETNYLRRYLNDVLGR
jgi:hypothetical protein